jgi:hypothetical protein
MASQLNEWIRFCAADGEFADFVREVERVMKERDMEPASLRYAAALIEEGRVPAAESDFPP